MTDMSDELREAMQRAMRAAADDMVDRMRVTAPGRRIPGYVPEPDADGVYRITDLRDPRASETGHPSTDDQPFTRHTNNRCTTTP